MRDPQIRQEIGSRLREERQRLGLTQQGLAELIAGARLSVVQYESGRSAPSAEALAAMEGVGIDVRFVLTGLRRSPSGIDRERFKIALAEVHRQAKARREKLSLDESLDLAWRFYDAVGALHSARVAA